MIEEKVARSPAEQRQVAESKPQWKNGSPARALLLIEDNPGDARLLREMLSEQGSHGTALTHVECMAEAEKHLAGNAVDIVLLDLGLPDVQGMEAVRRAQTAAPRVALVVLTGLDDDSLALQALKEGAQDYLVKGQIETRGLLRALRYAIERKSMEERYRSMMEHANDAMLVMEPGLRIREANRRAEELLGCPRDQIVGRSYESFVVPEDRGLLPADGAILLAEGAIRVEDRRLLRTDGSEVSVDVSASLIRFGDETVVLKILHDTSQRKRTERRLLESEEEYRILFDCNPHPLLVFDAETLTYLAVNAAAVQLYGYTKDEFLSMTVKDLRVPGDVPALLAYLATVPEGTDPIPSPLKHRKKDGSLLDVVGVSSPTEFRGRRARLVLVNDVTEKLHLEAQLVQAQKMEAVGRLAGGVAHDFNNLLGVILGYSEMLIRSLGPEHPASNRVELIHRAAQRAAGLTRQLLAFSRQQVLQPRILDINEVVADVEKMLRRVIGEDIDLVTSPGAEIGRIRADPGQIEQILMNLVVNSRDAMPKGGTLSLETANVTLSEAYARAHPEVQPGAFVMLSVTDTGDGMDAQTQAHMFEPFFTTKELGKGTGLGLATVFGIVQQSGGSIVFKSRLGEGTTCTIYFPRVEDALPFPSRLGPSDPSPRGTETVLLVEDADSLRVMVREILEGAGYVVLESSDPEEALLRVGTLGGPIHLMLTDVVMPRMSGPDLAKLVRVSRPDMKVLFMSGYTDEARGMHGVLDAGIRFIQKPFAADALCLKVREAIDGV